MKKVLIVGAGAQGGPCASILAREKEVSEIVIGDIDQELAKKVKEKIKSDKITAIKLNAANTADIAQAAKGADAIINLTVTHYCVNIMEAALRSGAHYVDTSFGEPSAKDIYSRDNILLQIIENRPLTLTKEFEDAGLTALLGCGYSPGEVNVLARHTCDKLEQVHAIRIRLGGRLLSPPKDVVRAWGSGWSPFRTLWGYAIEPTIFEDGQYKKCPIFSRPEEYHFPQPVGPVLQTLHQHQEPITLPHFIGKGIKYCDFKYPVDIYAGAFVKMGFASPDPIDVKGTKIVPRDVLLKLVRPPVNNFLAEDENTAKIEPNRVSFFVIEVTGVQSGEEVKYTVARPGFSSEENLDVYRKFGSTRIGVALPAIVGAEMCLQGIADRGTISSECLDPKIFLKMAADMGAPIRFSEILTKKVAY